MGKIIGARIFEDKRDSRDKREKNPALSIANSEQHTQLPANYSGSPASHTHSHELVALSRWSLEALSALLSSIWATTHFSIRSLSKYLYRHPIHAMLLSVVCIIAGFTYWCGEQHVIELRESKVSQETVNKILAASSYTRPYTIHEATKRGTREFLRVGAPRWAQEEAVRAVLLTARKHNLSLEHQAVLLATVEVESGFNPMAKAATTTACGLFQFVKRTGENFKLAQADCMDPWKNASAGVAHYLANFDSRIAPKLINLSGSERLHKIYELSYYMHHDGPLSKNHSAEVKAVVLKGSGFLFRAHDILLEEQRMKEKAPGFLDFMVEKTIAIF